MLEDTDSQPVSQSQLPIRVWTENKNKNLNEMMLHLNIISHICLQMMQDLLEHSFCDVQIKILRDNPA